jgi:hypothetical protein
MTTGIKIDEIHKDNPNDLYSMGKTTPQNVEVQKGNREI